MIPNKVFQALACARPVITADTLPRALLTDEADALLVRPGDPEALAGALRRLAATPRSQSGSARPAGRPTRPVPPRRFSGSGGDRCSRGSSGGDPARAGSSRRRAASSRPVSAPSRTAAPRVWSGRFDVGNLVQAVSVDAGDVLSVTGLTGRQISRLGAHFDPIVVAFAPLWWLWPDASLLLVSQAVAVATGAVPVYLLGKRHLGSEWAAAGFALRPPAPGDAVARARRLPPGRARAPLLLWPSGSSTATGCSRSP